MEKFFNEDLLATYGLMTMANNAVRTRQRMRDARPDLAAKVRENAKTAGARSLIDIDDLLPETSGDEDEVQEWLYELFLDPDRIHLPGGKLPGHDVPDLPRPIIDCDDLEEDYRAAMATLIALRRSVRGLRQTVEDMGKVANPVVQVFAALFKAALEEQQKELRAANREVQSIRDLADRSGCELPLVVRTPDVVLQP